VVANFTPAALMLSIFVKKKSRAFNKQTHSMKLHAIAGKSFSTP